MRLKPGTKLKGLQPQILFAAFVAEEVYAARGRDLWITSGNDGKHLPNSKHYDGQAIDIRTKNLDQHEVAGVVEAIRVRLNDEYDIVLETDHLHIEYDPK